MVALTEAGILIGKQAPDFTLKSPYGKDVSLYSIQKDYILLDFWGSWCTWCIKDFPNMKAFYTKYANNLEILGIACNDKQDAWLASIKKNKLQWMNVINNRENDVAAQYVINIYPTKILLDKDKKIIGIFKGESAGVYEQLAELIK